MSGQPVKNQSDINRFKNEYLESLGLMESINDMNLQANKTYLLTGQLPPQSQMMDTRTNAEKLKDVEQMKQKIASDLRPIAEPSVAYQIVSKVMESPLNIDNTLFRFLAQRASSLTEQISKLMPYGIAGDINDIERIVDFIKNMYSEQQGKFQSTKSYLNSVGSTTQSSRVMSGNDIDNVIIGLQDLIKNIQIIIQSDINAGGIGGADGILNRLSINMENLKNALPTTDQIKLLMSDIEDPNFNNPYPDDFGPQPRMPNYSRTDMEAFYKFIEKLPKYTEAMALINKIRQFLSSKNYPLVVEGIQNLDRMFSMLEDRNVFGPGNNIFRQFQEIKKRQENKQDKYQKLQSEQTREFITRQNDEQKDASRAQKVYVINPQNDAVWTRNNAGGVPPPGAAGAAAPAPPAVVAAAPRRPPGGAVAMGPPVPGLRPVAPFAAQARAIAITRNVNQLTPAELNQVINVRGVANPGVIDALTLTNDLINDAGYMRGDLGMFGLGIKKRVGRPRGSGLVKVEVPKVPAFIGFGINEINQKQLENGIVKIRRNTRSNYVDMPSKRVSDNLKSILKTITGGGVPKYDELGRLDEEEKEYLHKLVSRSNLTDRLSVPAPSKDAQEKDIHTFEIMKGQIMSGNDSVELVKKFKLLVRKLAKQGLLPKADVDDIIETLSDMNY